MNTIDSSDVSINALSNIPFTDVGESRAVAVAGVVCLDSSIALPSSPAGGEDLAGGRYVTPGGSQDYISLDVCDGS